MFWNRTAHPKDENLSAYLDGELRGAALAAMNAHVDGCERCRSLLDELSTAKSALASLPRETPRHSFQIAPQLKPAPRRSLIPAWTPAAALTVFLLLVAVDAGAFGASSSDDSATSGGALAGRAANESAGKSTDAASAPNDAFSSGTPLPAIAGAATTTAPSADAARQQPNAPPAATQQQGATSSQADRDDSGGDLGTLRLDDKDGRSLTTLDLLEGAFLALFLGSMLGLFVWPRFLRKGP